MAKYEIKRCGSVGKGTDSEGKKNKYCPGIVDCVDKYLGIFLKAFTAIGLLASILATISLLYYSGIENVDIFSHYSSWAPSLPVIALTAILVAFFLAFIVFFPIIYYYFYSVHEKEHARGFCRKRILLQLFFLVVVPDLLGLWFYFSGSVSKPDLYVSSITLVYVVALPLVFYFCFGKILSLIYVSFVIPFVSFVITVLFFVAGGISALIVWCVLLFGSFVWFYFRACGKDGEKNDGIEMLIYLGVFLFMFITPFSAIITRGALHVTKMGGGVKQVYYFYEDNRSKVPRPFIDDTCCDDYRVCLTEELTIKWAVGDLIYASLAEEENKQGGSGIACEFGPCLPFPKQTVTLPGNVLFPYSLDEGMPMGCKTQQKLIKAENERN